MICQTCSANNCQLDDRCVICSSWSPTIGYSTGNTVDQETCDDEITTADPQVPDIGSLERQP